MTNRNGSATMIRDIFGDEIPQMTDSESYSNPVSFDNAMARSNHGAFMQQNPTQPAGYGTFTQGSGYNPAAQQMYAPNMMPQNGNFGSGRNGMKRKGIGTTVLAGVASLAILASGTAATLTVHPEWNPFVKHVDPKPVTPNPVTPNPAPKPAPVKPVSSETKAQEMRTKLEKSTVYFTAVCTRTNPETGQEEQVNVTASGFVVDKNVIATDFHCVKGFVNGSVHLINDKGREYNVTVVAIDEEHDLALLYAPGLDAPALPLCQSDTVTGADSVWTLGNPGGIEGIFGHGMIGSEARNEFNQLAIVSDGVWHGASGAAFVNDAGEVVGIVDRGNGDPGLDGAGISWATPVYALRALLEQYKASADSTDQQQAQG